MRMSAMEEMKSEGNECPSIKIGDSILIDKDTHRMNPDLDKSMVIIGRPREGDNLPLEFMPMKVAGMVYDKWHRASCKIYRELKIVYDGNGYYANPANSPSIDCDNCLILKGVQDD